MAASRRQFIKKTALIGGIMALQQTEKILATPATDQALVISTWRFGLEANNKAMKILGGGGSALDAVEQGVRVVESDPNERSVGYGGRPDRDGYVTLDACIMDDKANCGSVMFLQHIKIPFQWHGW
jgi:N4-(beta-N-acetylglucosaminyl)-L-asparaginase